MHTAACNGGQARLATSEMALEAAAIDIEQEPVPAHSPVFEFAMIHSATFEGVLSPPTEAPPVVLAAPPSMTLLSKRIPLQDLSVMGLWQVLLRDREEARTTFRESVARSRPQQLPGCHGWTFRGRERELGLMRLLYFALVCLNGLAHRRAAR